MAMPSYAHGGHPPGITFSSAGPQPPTPGGGHFQVAGPMHGGGPGLADNEKNPVHIQQKMQRQRQLVVERQRAAARQRVGVGLVAQANPLPAVAATQTSQMKATWKLLSDGDGSAVGPSTGAVGGTISFLPIVTATPAAPSQRQLNGSKRSSQGAAGNAIVGGAGGGAGHTEDRHHSEDPKFRCPKGHGLKEMGAAVSGTCDECAAGVEGGIYGCLKCNWCVCRNCVGRCQDHSSHAGQKANSMAGGNARGNNNMNIDDMLDGLDVEELVDQFTREDSRQADDQAGGKHRPGPGPGQGFSVPVGPGLHHAGSGVGRSDAGERKPQGGRSFADDAGPKAGVWGVDEKLKVQGPPPDVLCVAGFDEPAEDFASPDRRGGGGGGGASGRPPRPRPGVEAPSGAAVGWDMDEDVVQPVSSEAKGGRRWWKPWEKGDPPAGAGRLQREESEVTQVNAFSFDD